MQSSSQHNSDSKGPPLHVKYRPLSFDEVIGQDAAIKALQTKLSGKAVPHAYLFTGPSGVGKTTLARILATELGCPRDAVYEIDAATYSGIENMRSVISTTQYTSLGQSDVKVFVVDECHALSKATWQSLLLALEEPPAHVYWCLCTTEIDKVPATIKTRCHAFDLKPVKKDILEDYLVDIARLEEIDVDESVVGLVADKAEGSVRQALVYLSTVEGCESRKEAFQLLETASDNAEIIDLVRFVAAGKGVTWPDLMKRIKSLQEQNQSAESIRLVMVNYVSSVLMGTKDEKQTVRYLSILSAFDRPYYQNEKYAPLLLSLGTILFED